MRKFISKLFTLVCIAGPAWLFGVLTQYGLDNGGLHLQGRGVVIFTAACFLAIVGLIRLFEIPVLRYRIKLVDKDEPPARASKL